MLDKLLQSEQGSVLAIILVAIILFASLSFVYSRMGDGNQKLMSEGQAQTVALQILGYAQDVERAVNRLIVKGCSQGEINFNQDWDGNGSIQSISADQNNPDAPTDNSCDIFSQNGANLHWKESPTGLLPSDLRGDSVSGSSYFLTGWITVDGVASSAPELVFVLRLNDNDKTIQICNAINRELGIVENHSEYYQSSYFPFFFNNYSGHATRTIGDGPTALYMKKTGCFRNTGFSQNVIVYHVVIPR